MLDHAFVTKGKLIEYGLKEPLKHSNKFSVLKLHGSLNWARCSECRGELQIVEASPLIGHNIPLPHPARGVRTKRPFRMMTQIMRNTQCHICKKQTLLEPEIIPPTWSKNITDKPLRPVWANAVKAIETAFQIVVIGYSMPVTDTFFQYLLTLGLSTNPNLHRVVVANADDSEALVKRYEGIFSRSMKERGRLLFLKHKELEKEFKGAGMMGGSIRVVVKETGKGGATFESFVNHDMMEIGSQV